MITEKAKPDVPRWRQHKPPPGPVVTVKGARAVRELGRSLGAAQDVPLRSQPGALAASGAFRFRYHLMPFWWLLWLLGAGLGSHALRVPAAGVLAAVASAAAVILLTRHLKDFARRGAQAMAALTAALVPVLALAGSTPPALPVVLGCWAAVVVPWIHHYRWRPQDPPALQIDTSDIAVWTRLAAKRKWHGYLGPREDVPGGRAYPIILDGAETNIGEVMTHPRPIAAAWDKSMTEAYVEPSADGVESRGRLTLLKAGTLARVREWDGRGADRATGRAVIGRFADGQDASITFWVPRDGTRHGLIAGATGSGKTYLLDLIVRVAVASGLVVPVILDPQEGQSLPQWRGHVPYASGTEECMEMLEGIRSGMFGRSRKLAARSWRDEDGHPMTGMDFFDPHLTGLKVVLAIGDEFPLLLKQAGRQDAKRAERALTIAGDIAKLGRKTGVSLWPVTQVPSLEEMGSRVLRSMLVGGNVVCLRTGERADAGMIGLASDPALLPRYFPDGTPTAGLGYVVGPELRQAPARIDMVPRRVRREIPAVPELDTMFAMATRVTAAGGI